MYDLSTRTLYYSTYPAENSNLDDEPLPMNRIWKRLKPKVVSNIQHNEWLRNARTWTYLLDQISTYFHSRKCFSLVNLMELFFQKRILNFIVQFLRMNASTPPIEHEFTVTSHHNISSVELSAQNTIKPLFWSLSISVHQTIFAYISLLFESVFRKCLILWIW